MNRNIHYIYIIALLLLTEVATPAFAQIIKGNVYGGGNLSQVEGSTTINIKSGEITTQEEGDGNIYGGGYGASAVLTGNTTINVTGGTVAKDVYGGGALANVTGSTEVNIEGGTVTQDVYGGGALANVSVNTNVNLTGGTIRDSYGGGLGQLAGSGKKAVAAIVNGDATVQLGSDDGLTSSKVLGSIFGANNINGTPKGHVFVHVLKTTPRDGQSTDEYDVAAVYGGGNQAAYEPTSDEERTVILIENCDNSIAYVYGGGNAAPVPATEVTVYGANAIDYLFGGGNGSGDGNPGANIGIKADNTTAYGAGTTLVNIYGGTVHEVFGGSNTKGLIKTSANVIIAGDPDETDTLVPCLLNVGNVHGGGNLADMLCGGSITLGCTQGVDVVYAGAEAADIHGDINLTITSGTYKKVFGGNNLSGNIYGSITINIDETGCYPIIIGDLYGGGNEAAYSVYGYNDDGTPKESGDNPSADPRINIISCTSIGNVYGGGYGATAKMYGSPQINVNMLEGKFAGTEMSAGTYYILNDAGERVLNATGTIPDAIGTIGTIYGGGEQAAVEGNTNVNICTEATVKHINASDEGVTPKVNITGDVYGGGKGAFVDGGSLIDAYVSGSTNVKIGKVK